MADLDAEDWNDEVGHIDHDYQRIDHAPDDDQLLGPWTLVALMLNRTIGSGIFVSPLETLIGTGSVGGSLMLWAFGCVFSTAGLLVWLELGLSIPFRDVKVSPGYPGLFERKSVPKNGGEFNYLAFIYTNPETERPKFLITCLYGIPFILLGTLAGNSIAIGKYAMIAAGQNPDEKQGAVLGIAITCLTFSILLHVMSRRGGIVMNNIFAVIKVSFLVAIIILGFLKAGGLNLGGAPNHATQNFRPSQSFKTNRHDLAGFTDAFQYVIYAFSGFLQPFYVLAEIAKPRKVFPKYTLIGMLITSVLFLLVNIAYLCAVPKDVDGAAIATGMAELFFADIFGGEIAEKVMNGLIAFSIFGGLVVMTFTAARVKQEIAKEGILPFSLFFATGHTTPWALLKDAFFSRTPTKGAHQGQQYAAEESDEDAQVVNSHTLEQTPMAALGLHWFASVVLIALTAKLPPTKAYGILVSLYIYVIRLLTGFFVAGGLLILRFSRSRNWRRDRNISFWGDYIWAGLFCAICGFLLVAAFVKPGQNSPFWSKATGYPWWLVPTIGISCLTWGFAWFCGLHIVMWWKKKVLVVTRRVFAVPDRAVPGQYVQRGDIVTHEWHSNILPSQPSINGYELRERESRYSEG